MIIKAGTKKAEQLLARADSNQGSELYHVYERVSQDKMIAHEKCRRLCYEDNGRNFRIISHNSYNFSVAWELDVVDEETGVIKKATRIRTKDNDYIVMHDE